MTNCEKHHRSIAIGVILSCLVIAASVQYPLPLNHDAAWHFEMSFRVLAGDKLERDVFDINPPMSAWLFLLPAWMAKASGVSPAAIFKTFTFLICSISYFWTLSLSDYADAFRSRIVMALALGCALLIMPGYDFGQREHLVAALTLPYIALAIRRAGGLKHAVLPAVLIGVAAAAAICIKPYFLALPLCIEVWLLVRRRSLAPLLRPEFISIGLFGLAYLFAVWVWAPDYYTRVVPDALVSYQGFDNPLALVLLASTNTIASCLMCALLAVLAWGSGRVPQPAQAFFSAALGFLIAALIQRKGWAYQLYPVKLYLIVAVGALYACRRKDVSARSVAALGVAVTLFLSIAIPIGSFLSDGYSSTGTGARVAALEKIFKRYSTPKDTVFAFITSPRDIHPAVLESGRRWAAASGVTTYLPAKLNLQPTIGSNPTTALQIDRISERENHALLDRLTNNPPAIIIVDVKRKKLGIHDPNFSYVEYFNRYARFRALWGDYRRLQRVGGFEIYLRKSSVAAAADPRSHFQHEQGSS